MLDEVGTEQPQAAPSDGVAVENGVISCRECDLMQRLPPAQPGDVIACARCGAHLRRVAADRIRRILPLTLAASVAFIVMTASPIVAIRAGGRSSSASLGGAVIALLDQGMGAVAILVALTTLIVPALDVTLLALSAAAFHRRLRPRGLGMPMRLMLMLRRWAMVEVFMLGVLVSIVKVAALAEIVPAVGLWALAAYLPLVAAAHSSFDAVDYWASARSAA